MSRTDSVQRGIFLETGTSAVKSDKVLKKTDVKHAAVQRNENHTDS